MRSIFVADSFPALFPIYSLQFTDIFCHCDFSSWYCCYCFGYGMASIHRITYNTHNQLKHNIIIGDRDMNYDITELSLHHRLAVIVVKLFVVYTIESSMHALSCRSLYIFLNLQIRIILHKWR